MKAQYGIVLRSEDGWSSIGGLEDTVALEAADSATEPASETNLIEQNVDEADWLKYDNANGALYYSVQPQWYGGWYDVTDKFNADRTSGKIEVFSLENTGTHQHQGTYSLAPDAHWISGLYTTDASNLIALYSKSEPFPDWEMSYYWRSGKVGLESIDTSIAENLLQQWKVDIDGYLVDSRRIGNELYLVTRFSPHLDGVTYNPWDESIVRSNIAKIEDASLMDLMPTIRINNQSQRLIPEGRCYLPAEDEWQTTGYNTFTSITRINLTDPTDWESSCAIAPVSQLYMNQESLYLMRGYGWSEARTELHRFDLNDGLNYTDSVVVPGSLGWTADAFRIKEQSIGDQRILTLITSDREANDWLHQLTNYSISTAGSFDLLATLPNENAPAAIGKPGENIRGARIDGTTAYVVTFLTVDPLYKIDISDPASPTMLGQLDIPGFSDYLHPVNEELLIGVGYQTPENGNARKVKVSLYDVSGDNPAVITEKLIGYDSGWNFTPAAWDHHAFTYLDYQNGTFRFTVPVSQSNWSSGSYENSKRLNLFEISTLDPSTNDITAAPEISVEQDQGYFYSFNNERSIIIGDSVHYAVNNKLISAMWQTPETKQVSTITEESAPIIEVFFD
jgi:hypothetical protein